jgi:glutathione S-transferase
MQGRTIQTSDLVLYHGETCRYCQRVRQAAAELGIDLPMKDAWQDPSALEELLAGGGRSQVPCLRIEDTAGKVRWMYESEQIVAYLQQRFGG